MNTATLDRPVHDPAAAASGSPTFAPGVGLLAQVRVELRKTWDTRAGIVLLSTVALIAAGAMAAYRIWGNPAAHTLFGYADIGLFPLTILLPIVGIIAVTQEWSQRTGLVTFALQPRRGRIVLAKVLAGVTLGVVALATVFGAAALVTLTAPNPDWAVQGSLVGGFLLAAVLLMLQGTSLGLALLNTPLAIVVPLVLPTAWMIAGGFWPAVAKAATWLDLGQAMGPLTNGVMKGADWAHLATATGFWIVLPLAIGTWRVLHREVK